MKPVGARSIGAVRWVASAVQIGRL